MILILLVLLKAIIGPTAIDRFIGINAITSKVSMFILLLAFYEGEYNYIDLAIVFTLCGFAAGLWVIKVLTPTVWEFKIPEIEDIKAHGEDVCADD